MNKGELVEQIAKQTSTKKEAQDLVENVICSIKKSLSKGKDVAISGLGIFKVKKTKARMGRNPKTGESIKIPAKKKVAFKAAKDLRESL